MEQLIFLVIIGLISLVNWLLQKSADHKAKREAEQRLQRRREMADSGELEREEEAARRDAEAARERRRKFMEALGVPVGDLAPSPHFPKPAQEVPPPLPQPVAVPVRNFLHKVDQDLEQRLVPTVVEVAPEVAPVLSRRQIRRERQAAAEAASRRKHPAAEWIGSPTGLRQAIIAREILGPPKGLDGM